MPAAKCAPCGSGSSRHVHPSGDDPLLTKMISVQRLAGNEQLLDRGLIRFATPKTCNHMKLDDLDARRADFQGIFARSRSQTVLRNPTQNDYDDKRCGFINFEALMQRAFPASRLE